MTTSNCVVEIHDFDLIVQLKKMLFVGSYNHLLYGLELGDEIKQSFIHSTHTETLTCVASSGQYIATGSTDTSIWIFNNNTRKEIGSLVRHQGSITSLCFYKTKHLLSASSDGTLCVWRTKDWECLLQVKAHARGVRAMSVHPSGRMAITLGDAGKKAKLWNLLTGKVATVFRLNPSERKDLVVPAEDGSKPHFGRDFKDSPQNCKWSPSGDLFLVQWTSQVDVYRASGSTKEAEKCCGVDDRVTASLWLGDNVIVIGTEKGKIVWFSLDDNQVLQSQQTKSRVKDLAEVSGEVCSVDSAGNVCTFKDGEMVTLFLDDRLTCCCTGSTKDAEDTKEPAQKKGKTQETAHKKDKTQTKEPARKKGKKEAK